MATRQKWQEPKGLPPSASLSSEEKLLTDSIIRAVRSSDHAQKGNTMIGKVGRFAPWILLVATLFLVVVWLSAPTWVQGDDEAAPKCNCYYPSTGEYGVIRGGGL